MPVRLNINTARHFDVERNAEEVQSTQPGKERDGPKNRPGDDDHSAEDVDAQDDGRVPILSEEDSVGVDEKRGGDEADQSAAKVDPKGVHDIIDWAIKENEKN